jgi:hypothetical protein
LYMSHTSEVLSILSRGEELVKDGLVLTSSNQGLSSSSIITSNP